MRIIHSVSLIFVVMSACVLVAFGFVHSELSDARQANMIALNADIGIVCGLLAIATRGPR